MYVLGVCWAYMCCPVLLSFHSNSCRFVANSCAAFVAQPGGHFVNCDCVCISMYCCTTVNLCIAVYRVCVVSVHVSLSLLPSSLSLSLSMMLHAACNLCIFWLTRIAGEATRLVTAPGRQAGRGAGSVCSL